MYELAKLNPYSDLPFHYYDFIEQMWGQDEFSPFFFEKMSTYLDKHMLKLQ